MNRQTDSKMDRQREKQIAVQLKTDNEIPTNTKRNVIKTGTPKMQPNQKHNFYKLYNLERINEVFVCCFMSV